MNQADMAATLPPARPDSPSSFLVFRRVDGPDSTPRQGGGRSAGISDGNRDGNDGSHQRPEATVDSQLHSHVRA